MKQYLVMGKFRSALLERLKHTPKIIFRRKNSNGEYVNLSKTEAAQIFVINHKGRPAIFRWDKKNTNHPKENALAQYYATLIAHELFPKNTLKPIEVTKKRISFFNQLVRHDVNIEVFGVVSEIVKKRSKDYKDFQKKFYDLPNDPVQYRKAYSELISNHPHYKWFKEETLKERQELTQAGISFENYPVNTINANGVPVFVEVTEIQIGALRNYLATKNISSEKRKRIEELISLYKPYRKY